MVAILTLVVVVLAIRLNDLESRIESLEQRCSALCAEEEIREKREAESE